MANPNFVSNAIMVGVVVAFGLIIVGFLSDKPVWFWFALPVLIVGVGLAAMALVGSGVLVANKLGDEEFVRKNPWKARLLFAAGIGVILLIVSCDKFLDAW
jgi:dipeptide/tripeptide permease